MLQQCLIHSITIQSLCYVLDGTSLCFQLAAFCLQLELVCVQRFYLRFGTFDLVILGVYVSL